MKRRAQRQAVEFGSRNRKQQLINEAMHRLNLLRFPRWGPKRLAEIREGIRRQNQTISEAELTDLVKRIQASSEYGGKGLSKEKAAVVKAFLRREGVDVEDLYGTYTPLMVKLALENQNSPQVVATSRTEETETLKNLRRFLKAWKKAEDAGIL